MAAYAFEALDAEGRAHKGVLEADTARAARSQLRTQNLVPLKVDPVVGGQSQGSQGTGLNRTIFESKIFNASSLSIWTRQLAGLVSAGLSLERSLTALTDEAEDERQRNLMASLRAEVNGGSSFGRALSHHPREFSPIYTAVIEAGEHSGNLGIVLEKLADDLEESQALKQKLIGAALYPAIVTLVAIVIVTFLVSYVVPQVAGVFAGTKQSLPFLTVMMLAISKLVREHGWWILLVLIAFAFIFRGMLKQEAFRETFDAFFLKIPLVGKVARGYNAARFASTLAMLAAAGVPILRALQAAAETVNNRAMRADALDAIILVREGAPLASAMAQKKRFPGIVSMFARLGEQTGQLPLMLQRAATQLSTEVQRRAMHLATILEPLLIVVMGLVVMLIVLAVMLPIIQLNQWVK